jgi:tetratricopeptide (TPR) repeat protein
VRDALTQFEAAAGVDETRAEARTRGGWTLFQIGRLPEALEWLDAAEPGDDRDLAYWLGLFKGRVLDGLGRFQRAATAYQGALALYPGAQSAGIGLALELVRLDRDAEADEVARALRAAGAMAPDPWSTYLDGDQRFVDRWVTQLRAGMR